MPKQDYEVQVEHLVEQIHDIQRMNDKLLEEISYNCHRNISKIMVVSQSRPYRVAHFLAEFKKLLTGTSTEKKEVWNWLFKDRTAYSSANYMQHLMSTTTNTLFVAQRNSAEIQKQMKYLEHLLTIDTKVDIIYSVVEKYEGKYIILLPQLVDWNIPLFQRPEQLAMAFARQGVLFVYTTPNHLDKISVPTLVEDNCLLITDECTKIVLDAAKENNKHIVFDICSTDNTHFDEWFNQWAEYEYSILYEYIDEISEAITATVPKETLIRHERFLRDENVYVVATADKLYDEVISLRGSSVNTLSSGNGVDLGHFQIDPVPDNIPDGLRDVITSGKPIIGYFGAIANWFDFDLLLYAAKQRPDYIFLMIGPNYGNHDLSALKIINTMKNIVMPGPIDYKILPHVANHFTVATIPFVLNDITESTSPIKLFEYMSMGKPCVTTAMRECFKYPEVMIGNTREEYVRCLDEAVKIVLSPEYPEHKKQLKAAAEKNSWLNKAKEISELIGCEKR